MCLTRLGAQMGSHPFGNQLAQPRVAFLSMARNARCQDYIGQILELRPIYRRQRFGLKDIQRRTRQMSGPHCGGQRKLIHVATACWHHQNCILLHHADGFGIDQMARALTRGNMHADDVGLRKETRLINPRYIGPGRVRIVDKRIGRDHVQAKGFGWTSDHYSPIYGDDVAWKIVLYMILASAIIAAVLLSLTCKVRTRSQQE